MSRFVYFCAAVTAASVFLVAPGHAQQPVRVELTPGFSAEAELLRKAQSEGAVSYWCSFRAPECAQVANRFEELTKVKVDFVRLGTGGILTRLSKEKAAGIKSVDVISHGDRSSWETIHKPKKWLVAYVPEGVKTYAPEFRDPAGFYAAHWLLANGIAYNTKLVPENEVPKRYSDLLDPKWKGRLFMPHPKHSGAFAETVAVLSRLLGWEYFKKLEHNDPLITIGSQFAALPVVRNGERQVALGAVDAIFLEAQDKSTGFVYPEEGTIVNPVYAGLVSDSPHPNAGKLFLEWLHSAPMQSMLAAHYWLMPHPDTKYPTDRVPLKDLKVLVLPAADAATADVGKTKFSEIFGG